MLQGFREKLAAEIGIQMVYPRRILVIDCGRGPADGEAAVAHGHAEIRAERFVNKRAGEK